MVILLSKGRSMRNVHWLLLLGAALFFLSLTGACKGQQSEARQPDPQPEYTTTATVKDLMVSIVDPSADVVWNSVTTVLSTKGIKETAPQNDEEWKNVRQGAIRLAEAGNLLMIPGRRVGRPGEKSETPGVELEPQEMDALIAQDRGTWITRAKALHDASAAALDAIDQKDAPKLFEVGEQIERACENCHTHYWYPNEKIPGPGPSAP